MKVRADQVLMAAVIGIGAWAFGKLVLTKPENKPAEPDQILKPAPAGLPPIPQDVGRGPLRLGQAYLGRFDLAGPPDLQAIEALLRPAFSSVQFFDRADAERVIPPIPFVLDVGPAGTWTVWFYGKARATGPVERPVALTYLWPTSL